MSVVQCIGLGAIGWPMAVRRVAAGHAVRGIDRDPVRLAQWEDRFGRPAAPADVVVVCVTDEAAARGVLAHVLDTAARGTLVIDHTTTSAAFARQAHEQAAAAGLRWCDAPLSGGVTGAQAGELVAMVGAREQDLPDIRSVLAATTREVIAMGPPGTGQLAKMANQLAVAGVAAGLAQAQRFARDAGLDLFLVFQALLQGSARSVQLERLHASLAAPHGCARREFGWLRKDLELCAAASENPLPLVRLWQSWWEEAR